jgi:CBS domain-containing protein
MKVNEIMSSPVVTVGPDTPIKEVAGTLVSRNISAVPVVDRHGEIIGIVSEADLVPMETVPDPRLQVSREPGPARSMPWVARNVMTEDVVCLPEDADIATAAKVMLERGVKRVPIVTEGQIVGIVSRRDLLKVLARPDDEIFEELEALLADPESSLGSYDVVVSEGHVTLVGSADPRTTCLAELLVRDVPGVVDVEIFQRPAAKRTAQPG